MSIQKVVKIQLLPMIIQQKYSQVIHGFVRSSDLSFSMPKMITMIILCFYGSTINIQNKYNIHPQISKIFFISMKIKHSFQIYFREIKYQHKIIMGLINNNNIKKRKLYTDSTFTGMLFVKKGHCFYRNGILQYHSRTTMKSKYCLKIAINFDFENKISYEINDGYFKNQFVYGYGNVYTSKKKILFSSPMDTEMYKEQDEDQTEQFCIQLFDFADQISITNITKN